MKRILDPLSDGIDESEFRKKDPSGVVADFIAAEPSASQLDIEIAALFTAMISWGNRKAIRSAAHNLIFCEMKSSPAKYIRKALYEKRRNLNRCVYRTLDFRHFRDVCRNLREALKNVETIEELVIGKDACASLETICSILQPAKVGSIGKSPCKRMCMFLRWMTRTGAPDFGIWKTHSKSDLLAVMDVHVNRQTLAMRKCRTPSWKGCLELSEIFKSWDPEDPLKYDVALMMYADSL